MRPRTHARTHTRARAHTHARPHARSVSNVSSSLLSRALNDRGMINVL